MAARALGRGDGRPGIEAGGKEDIASDQEPATPKRLSNSLDGYVAVKTRN